MGRGNSDQRRIMLVTTMGLLMGGAASLPLAAVWPYPQPPPGGICLHEGEFIRLLGVVLPLACPPAYAFVQPLVWGAFLAAGMLFGLTAHRLSDGRGSQLGSVGVGGLLFFMVGFFAAQFADKTPSFPVPGGDGIPFAFSTVVATAILLFTTGLGLTLHTPRLIPRAMAVAAITFLSYFTVSATLFGGAKPLPALLLWPHLTPHLGPMLRTVMLSNLIAGTIGGASALFLLTERVHVAKQGRNL